MGRLLDGINSPKDLKELDINKFDGLAKEIRKLLLQNISKTGGHLASNLGVVELTIALHYCFSTPKDKIIWDVGHQAYIHKIFTGRKDVFHTLRQFNGLSGFPRPQENENDIFATGHSSTSISAALGFAAARDIAGEDNSVIAIIGDGAMTAGLAFEGLNNAGQKNTDIIVILNDNQMSISSNVGAVSKHLNDIRTDSFYLDLKKNVHKVLTKVPGVGTPIDKAIGKVKDTFKHLVVNGCMFEEMGFNYIGPIDGHDTKDLIEVLNKAKKMKGPILLHVYTKKGKGYKQAELRPYDYHMINKFDLKTGIPLGVSDKNSYSNVFGEAMVEFGDKYKKLVSITAAMKKSTALEGFETKFPSRFFDVAIAEQHAVTFAAGLAAGGFIPVFAVYSTFLQRGYDQIVHDVCLQNLHVIFAVDRAGLVGGDGETHQGIFDLSFLSHIPNMTIIAPKNGIELKMMLEFAINCGSPIAIRYPKDTVSEIFNETIVDIEHGKSEIIKDGSRIAILSCGSMMDIANDVYNKLTGDGYTPVLVNARFIKPIDTQMIKKVAENCDFIFTIEDNLRIGGYGSLVLEKLNYLNIKNVKFHSFAFSDSFIEHGTREQLYLKYNMDSKSIYMSIKKIIIETDEQ